MSNDIVPSNLSPAEIELYAQDTGSGLDDAPITTASRIPSLMLLHALSPQIKDPESPATNADIGRIMHSQTADIYDSVVVNIVKIAPRWVERLASGKKDVVGLLPEDGQNPAILSARENANNPQGKIFGAVKLPNGNEAVEVFHVFGFRLSEAGLFDEGTFEVVLMKIKLTGTANLGSITEKLGKAATRIVDGVVLDPHNFSLRVKGGDYKLRNGLVTNVFAFEGVLGSVEASVIPPVVNGVENPVRVAGREFLKKFAVHGTDLIESFYNYGNDDEDDDVSAIS